MTYQIEITQIDRRFSFGCVKVNGQTWGFTFRDSDKGRQSAMEKLTSYANARTKRAA